MGLGCFSGLAVLLKLARFGVNIANGSIKKGCFHCMSMTVTDGLRQFDKMALDQ